MDVKIEITERELKDLVVNHLLTKMNLDGIKADHLKFEVKTSKNYRLAEWEVGQFRMTLNHNY